MSEYESFSARYVYDPRTGELYFRSNVNADGRGGNAFPQVRADGYATVYHAGKDHKFHRVAFLLMTGSWPKLFIDHINGNKADNRWCNLREVSRSVNGHNNTARGTYYKKDRDKWTAAIRLNGKLKHLGYFATEPEAHAAYCAAKALNALIHRPTTAPTETLKESFP